MLSFDVIDGSVCFGLASGGDIDGTVRPVEDAGEQFADAAGGASDDKDLVVLGMKDKGRNNGRRRTLPSSLRRLASVSEQEGVLPMFDGLKKLS